MNFIDEITHSMQESIDYLSGRICYTITPVTTHQIITVTCWNDDASTRTAIAKYLVGLIACAIDAALNIRANLENTASDLDEIIRSVEKIVNSPDENHRRTERNPWIAEGLWHLCMAVAKEKAEIHPVGQIIAAKLVNISAKDHGLDVAVIYTIDSASFGLSFVECKAYKNDPNGAITKSVDFFKEIDQGDHDWRIRQSVQMLRSFLPATTQSAISNSFWKANRTYIPNPHYDESCSIDWSNSRPSFSDLGPDSSNIIIMPHAIKEFDQFFEHISDDMKAFATSLRHV